MNRGFAPVLIVIGIVSVLAAMSLTITMTAGMANSRYFRRLNRIEGFYTGELAAWHNVLRSQQGLEGLTPLGGGYTLKIDNRYVENVDGLVPDSYDTTPGVALNVATTKDYAPSKALIRRYSDGAVRYLASEKTGGYCGATQYGKKHVGICLAGGIPKPPATSLCKRLEKPPGEPLCFGTVSPSAAAMAQPIELIRTQQDLEAMHSVGRYRLENDIQLDPNSRPIRDSFSGSVIGSKNFSPKDLSDIVFDGAGFTISGLNYEYNEGEAGLFRSLRNSIVYNLKLKDFSISITQKSLGEPFAAGALVGLLGGNSCIENVRVNNANIAADAAGGIVGRIYNRDSNGTIVMPVVIAYSSANVFINSQKLIPSSAGGVVGKADTNTPDSIPENVMFYGLMASGDIGPNVQVSGGLIGLVNQALIKKSCSGPMTVSGLIIAGLAVSYPEVGLMNSPNGWINSKKANIYISESFSEARLFMEPNATSAGGLITNAGTTVTANLWNCFFRGDINENAGSSSPAMLGGLVANIAAGFISNSFSAAKIMANDMTRNGPMKPGGVIRMLISGGIWDYDTTDFFDKDRAGPATEACGRGLTTDQMLSLSTYNGYDFNNTWNYEFDSSGALDNNGNRKLKDYPTLVWAQ